MTCPTCGAKTGKRWTIFKVLLGMAVMAVVGVPMLIVVLLAAIAAVGTSADENYPQAAPQVTPTSAMHEPAAASPLAQPAASTPAG